jgi:hypothetical protein
MNTPDHKEYIISKGGKELGIMLSDIKNHILTPSRYEDFSDFMIGQTCGIMEGASMCYTGDFERFLLMLNDDEGPGSSPGRTTHYEYTFTP